MSEHYERGKYAAPESYQARISTAWLEHNQRFRPSLQKWQDMISSTACKANKKGKWIKIASKKEITKATTDYVLLSMSSFMQYLTEYTSFFIVKKFSDENFKITNSEIDKFLKQTVQSAKLALVKSLNAPGNKEKKRNVKTSKNNNKNRLVKKNRLNTRRRNRTIRSTDSNEQLEQSASSGKLQTRRKRRTISN